MSSPAPPPPPWSHPPHTTPPGMPHQPAPPTGPPSMPPPPAGFRRPEYAPPAQPPPAPPHPADGHPYAQRPVGTPGAPKPGALAQFGHGIGLAARGFAMWGRRPKLMLLGAIPALITAILFVVGFVFLFTNLGDLSAWATGFADGWAEGWRATMRVIAGVSISGVAFLLAFLSYASVTMIVGDPFYEAISGEVEKLCGGVRDEVELGFWGGLGRSIAEAVRLLLRTAVVGLILFAAGFVPFVGQTVIPVIGALVAGWFFTVGIVSVPFARRGVDYTARRELLAKHRAMAVGFGTGYVLLFLIPGGAVIATPAAVAGGTLLARELGGEPAVPVPPGNTGAR